MKTRIVTIDPQSPNPEVIKDAALIVRDGGLVAFPTETVYGIACRAHRESLARLDAIKGGRPDKPYTLHIGSRDEVAQYVLRITLRQQKIIDFGWPGPLTMVFDLGAEELDSQRDRLGSEVFECLYSGNSIGIRCPDNAIASMLLDSADCPVVAPSANHSGEEPPVTAQEVAERVGAELDLIIDGGPCTYKLSSTVARMTSKGVEVLRQGAYSREELEAASVLRFLFVCTGNTCRSPMAEGIFRKYVAEKTGCEVDDLEQFGYKIASAGTGGMAGGAPSTESVIACKAKGIDISDYISQAVDRELIEASDYVFAMSAGHRDYMVALCPDAVNKCRLLAVDRNVPDPIGQSQVVYDACANMIDEAVRTIIGGLEI